MQLFACSSVSNINDIETSSYVSLLNAKVYSFYGFVKIFCTRSVSSKFSVCLYSAKVGIRK
jgi:hypothetical protein